MRGRVLGVLAVAIGSGPIGALHIGWLATQIGTDTAVLAIAITGLILTTIPLPHLAKVPTEYSEVQTLALMADTPGSRGNVRSGTKGARAKRVGGCPTKSDGFQLSATSNNPTVRT